jgi:hypothetical protein
VAGPDGVTVSCRAHAEVDGNALIGLGVVSLVLTWVFRWYRGLWVTGVGALAMVAGTSLKAQQGTGVGLAALAWGWLVLLAGAGALLSAALVAEMRRPRGEGEQAPAEGEQAEE